MPRRFETAGAMGILPGLAAFPLANRVCGKLEWVG